MDNDGSLERIAALAEPNRRRIHAVLAGLGRPATRRELAQLVGISENLLTFHLDKLTEAGVIRVAPAVRESRRRGRPGRHYELLTSEVSASVPPRRYDRVAEVLALAAREQMTNETFQAAAERVGASVGRQLAHAQVGKRTGSRTSRRTLRRVLEDLGYQPSVRGSEVLLDNCPYDRLREVNTPLVCGINRALLQGCVAALGIDDAAAHLDPDPSRCCVVVTLTVAT